jgi:hypothetical protein
VGNSHIKFWEINGHTMVATRKEKISVPLYKVVFTQTSDNKGFWIAGG